MEQNFIQYVYRQYVYHSFSLQMRYLYRVSDEESGGRRFFLHRATTKGQFGRTCPETYEKKKNSGVVRSRDESPILSQSHEITPWHVHLKTIYFNVDICNLR